MVSKYAENGAALSGTPLARLCDRSSRGESVYAGDVRDVLESIGQTFDHPDAGKLQPGDLVSIPADKLQSMIAAAVTEVVAVEETPVDLPLKEQVRRGRGEKTVT